MPACRILIAEDQRILAEEIAESLEDETAIVVLGIANNGAEAVQLTYQFSPDVVLMDIEMPIMDGIQATRIIRQEKPETRVLVLTVLEDDAHLFEALKCGATGYLLKNSTTTEIAQAIRAVAAGEAALPPAQAARVLSEFDRLARQRQSLLALFEKLSRTEITVLSLVGEGKTNVQIARTLYVEETTVKSHLTHILKKLEVNNRIEAARIARQSGLQS